MACHMFCIYIISLKNHFFNCMNKYVENIFFNIESRRT